MYHGQFIFKDEVRKEIPSNSSVIMIWALLMLAQLMAYIPPHKRHSKDADKPSPKPELLAPKFQKKTNFGPSMSNVGQRKNKFSEWPNNILNADDVVYMWFAVGIHNDSHRLSAFRLEPVSIKAIEQKIPLMLVRDNNIVEGELIDFDKVIACPWDFIADHVVEVLFRSYENLKKVEGYEVDEVHAKLVARFGKVIFHGKQSLNLETDKSDQSVETSLRQMKKLFRTNVPISYGKYITDEAVTKIGLSIEEEKESYHVRLRDTKLPGCLVSCRCRVRKDSKSLELYKLVIGDMRHMVVDASCLDKDLDLRLMLYSKKNIIILSEDEKKNINSLIDSAVIDPSVKGGLRWSLGKDSSGERYTVVGVWHTKSKFFTSPSLRLEVLNADRIDFRDLSGEVTQEVTLKMKGLLSQLQGKNNQSALVAELLKENIKLIWDCFLSCDSLIN